MSDDETGTPMGQIVDNLGVRMSLEDGDMVTDALVLTKIVSGEGLVQLGIAASDGMSWIERLGLLNAALVLDSPHMVALGGDDDD